MMYPFTVFGLASAPFPDGPAPFDEPKMMPMLRLHNDWFGNAAMQQPHDFRLKALRKMNDF